MDAIRQWVTTGVLSDPDVVRYAATVSVWGRWFTWLVGAFLLAYRPGFWYPEDIEFLALPVLLAMVNGLVHLRLLTNRTVTWRWMLLLSAADIALVTAGVVNGGGFRSFIFLAYYPSLAVFAVIFSSFWLSLAWTTAAAVQAPALLNDAVEAILDRRQLVLPACCLIEKCYRNFSTWGPPQPALIPALQRVPPWAHQPWRRPVFWP